MVLGEKPRVRVLGVEHADHLVVVDDRYSQLRQSHLVVQDVARVLAGILDALHLPRLRHRPDDAFADRDGDRVVDVGGHGVLGAVRGPLNQSLAVFVQQVDHAVHEAEPGDRGLGHVPHDVLE